MVLMAIGVVLAFRMQPEARFEATAAHPAQSASTLKA
jgi:hypothetical protein